MFCSKFRRLGKAFVDGDQLGWQDGFLAQLIPPSRISHVEFVNPPLLALTSRDCGLIFFTASYDIVKKKIMCYITKNSLEFKFVVKDKEVIMISNEKFQYFQNILSNLKTISAVGFVSSYFAAWHTGLGLDVYYDYWRAQAREKVFKYSIFFFGGISLIKCCFCNFFLIF